MDRREKLSKIGENNQHSSRGISNDNTFVTRCWRIAAEWKKNWQWQRMRLSILHTFFFDLWKNWWKQSQRIAPAERIEMAGDGEGR